MRAVAPVALGKTEGQSWNARLVVSTRLFFLEELSRRAAKRFEGSNVSAKEALERLVEGKAREEGA